MSSLHSWVQCCLLKVFAHNVFWPDNGNFFSYIQLSETFVPYYPSPISLISSCPATSFLVAMLWCSCQCIPSGCFIQSALKYSINQWMSLLDYNLVDLVVWLAAEERDCCQRGLYHPWAKSASLKFCGKLLAQTPKICQISVLGRLRILHRYYSSGQYLAWISKI